jgi:hypothetical protein
MRATRCIIAGAICCGYGYRELFSLRLCVSAVNVLFPQAATSALGSTVEIILLHSVLKIRKVLQPAVL